MKFTTVYKSIVITALSTLVLAACTRSSKEEPFLGPKVLPAPEGFAIQGDSLGFKFTNSGTKVNFLKGTTYFESKFSSEVSWKLAIVSRANGAVKTLTGTSATLDNVTCPWNGESDYLLFSDGDTCDANLTITGYADDSKNIKMTTKSFVIDSAKNYNDGIKNHLIVDFEAGAGLATPYFDAQDGNLFSNPEYGDSAVHTQYALRNAAHGKFSLRCAGNDVNSNGYIAGYDMKSLVGLVGQVKETDPSEVYLNMYVKGFGKHNTGLTLLLYELDTLNVDNHASITGGKNIADTKQGALAYTNDKWIKQVNVNWVGWKLVSVKYSEFKKPNNEGCNGNCKLEPHKLRGMSIGLDSYPATGYSAEFAVDYFILTEGGPFKP
jgi:hypothetical protein